MKLLGTVRNYELHEPGTFEWFFRSTTLHFLLVTDAPIDLPSGSTSIVPVRFDAFERLPSLEGARLEVEGEYDGYLEMVRANVVSAPEWRLSIAAARRMRPLSAALWIIGGGLAQYLLLGFFFGLLMFGIANMDVIMIAAGGAGVIFCIFLGVYLLFLYKFTAVNSLVEWISHILSRFVAYSKKREF